YTVYDDNIGRTRVRGGARWYRDLPAVEERVIEHVLRGARAAFDENLGTLIGEQQSGEPARQRRTPFDHPHAPARRRSRTHITMPLGHLRCGRRGAGGNERRADSATEPEQNVASRRARCRRFLRE